MTDLTRKFDKFTPIALILVFFAAFLSAAERSDHLVDIDSVLSASNDQIWIGNEKSSYVRLDNQNSIQVAAVQSFKPELTHAVSVRKNNQISKTLPNFETSLLHKGKPSSVRLENNFDKLVTKKRKLKVLTLVQAKKSTKKKKVTLKQDKAKKKSAKENVNAMSVKTKKYNIFSSKSKWQPKGRTLTKVFKKVLASGKLSTKAVTKAFKYYEKNKSHKGLSNKYLVVADYTRSSKSKRMHLINLKSGKIGSYQVAHGKRSGPVGGRVHATSNRRNSHMTSKGFFKVGYKEGRTIKKGYKYLSVTGLERGNRKVGLPSRQGGRDVVIHTASYVNGGGRSFGCFAIRPQDKRRVFGKIKGALFYSYAG